MKIRFFTLAAVLFISYGCSASPSSEVKKSSQHGLYNCSNSDNKFEIVQFENKLVSICGVGGENECHYTESLGKTFTNGRPDLNGDGLLDYVIRDFTGSYGLNDITHFMIFAQCKAGGFVKVGDNFFTTIKYEKIDFPAHWMNLTVTRSCYDTKIDDTRERSFVVKFDDSKEMYGAPNGDPSMMQACSNKELSLP